jgi:arylsulfotransferase ASST
LLIFQNRQGVNVLNTRTRPAASALLAVTAISLCACTPATNDSPAESTAATAEPAAPLYISRKQVSTDCGVAMTAPPPPGFADVPNEEISEMPDMLAKWQTVGAERPVADTNAERVSPGYVLIEPGYRKTKYLINNDKEVVAKFENDYFGFTQLQADGSRLSSSNIYSDVFQDGGGNRGCLEEYAADGSLNWRLRLETDEYIHHHDAVKLPNGNVLALVWENISTAQAIALGRNPDRVAENGNFWFDGIIEVNPMTAEIVWEWSMRNHIVQDFDAGKPNYGVVADNPGKLDLNVVRLGRDGTVGDDWTHANALDYNADLDQIIFSSNYLSEIYIIDHGTTSFEAQGSAGDFIYRWGNSENYDRGTPEDRQLFNQHDVQWIRPGLPGAGNILVFNNGDGKLRPYSSVVEFSTPLREDGRYALDNENAYGPTDLAWEYAPMNEDIFFSWFISGTQRLANGNTLVDHGAKARVREVTPEGDIVWEYIYDDGAEGPHMLFRANRYPADHPAVIAIINGDIP